MGFAPRDDQPCSLPLHSSARTARPSRGNKASERGVRDTALLRIGGRHSGFRGTAPFQRSNRFFFLRTLRPFARNGLEEFLAKDLKESKADPSAPGFVFRLLRVMADVALLGYVDQRSVV